MPIPICWNANHDIYYTGGDRFVEDSDLEELVDIIAKAVEKDAIQYTDRIISGENLQPWNLKCWCNGTVGSSIAKWFYDHRFKK